MKMLWDQEYIYIIAKIEEPHIWGDITKRDTIVFYNNDFEVFVDPDGDTHNYYELETTALNTAWDIFLTKPYREKGNAVINDWDVIGLKSAVYVDGTINDPSDIDKAWYLEMAIPWKTLESQGVKRDQLRINFRKKGKLGGRLSSVWKEHRFYTRPRAEFSRPLSKHQSRPARKRPLAAKLSDIRTGRGKCRRQSGGAAGSRQTTGLNSRTWNRSTGTS